MEITKETMEKAAPYLACAERQLDILIYYVRNKDRLSLDARVPMALNRLVEAASALQQLFYNQDEFGELFARTLAEVSKDREYNFWITKDNDGKAYFDVHGLLPLEQVQRHMLLTGGIHEAVITVSGPEYTRSEETS